MDQRIQRDAAQVPGRRIAQSIGRPRMGGLVDAQRQQKDNELDNSNVQINIRHNLVIRRQRCKYPNYPREFFDS